MEDILKKMVISYLEDNYAENIPKFKDYEKMAWITQIQLHLIKN